MRHLAAPNRCRLFSIVSLALGAGLALLTPPAIAQIPPHDVPSTSEGGPITDMPSDPFVGTYDADVLTLTGAANIATSTGEVALADVKATVEVTVGEHPVQITPTLGASFRLVNGGGTTTDPTTTVTYEAIVIDADSTDIVLTADGTATNWL